MECNINKGLIMTQEKFEEIMTNDKIGGKLLSEPGCNALKGLFIITKYLPNAGIEGANHDIIYFVDVNKIVNAGITEEDTILLRKYNWMIEDSSYLACFV